MLEESISINTAKEKLARFCVYQERCRMEVHSKLISLGVKQKDIPEIIDFLEDEDFLNEERFTSVYVRSKFELKKWGKLKIRSSLKSKGLPLSLIEQYLNAIDEEEYQEQIDQLILKKATLLSTPENVVVWRKKILNFMLSKGYELALVQPKCFKITP